MTDIDPRVEATAKSLYERKTGWSWESLFITEKSRWLGDVTQALTAADAADCAAGFVRVRVDDKTVDVVAKALADEHSIKWDEPGLPEWVRDQFRATARAVLAALRGES